jgi:N-acetylglucosaminyl-diphospho-decaprenol L-rhamnosyltransferase
MKADVAIVIVSYNSRDHIGACLESVFAQRKSVTQQVIVVDNDSRDDTVNFIRENFPQVELVLPGANLGFAKGVNLGVKHANAEYVLLLNPDTVILDHAVDVIVDFARKKPGHGLYGGRTLRPDGSLEPSSCWGMPTLWSMTLFAFGLTTIAPKNRFLDPESLGSWQRDTVREVGVITGCFLLSPTEVWNKLGGLDERYFMYGEDADLAMRARNAGYRPVICPDAKLVHEVGACSDTPVHKTMLLYRGKASLVRTTGRASPNGSACSSSPPAPASVPRSARSKPAPMPIPETAPPLVGKHCGRSATSGSAATAAVRRLERTNPHARAP